MSLDHVSVGGWFFIGLSAAFGPCLGHHFLVVLPYIGMTGDSARGALTDVLYFSAARILTYTALGTLAAAVGMVLYRVLVTGAFIVTARALLGLFLMVLALAVLLLDGSSACRRLHRSLIRMPGRAMVLAGVLAALTPCPLLLGLVTHAAASGNPGTGAASGAAFALGTALSPLLVMGPVFGFGRERLSGGRLAAWARYLGGFILFAFGLHLAVSALLTRLIP